MEQPLLTAIAEGEELERQALASADFEEGVMSFVERRPPLFPALRPTNS